MQILSEQALQAALAGLNHWTLLNGKLRREYKFPDFAAAIGFMTFSAFAIEKMNHHPEWSNTYNRVTVDLTTHDAGGITARDLELAGVLDRAAAKLQ